MNQEAFPGRGGDRRKVVGGFGIGIGTTCRSVDGFKRGLRLRLLPEWDRELSWSTVVYVTFLLHSSFFTQTSTTSTATFHFHYYSHVHCPFLLFYSDLAFFFLFYSVHYPCHCSSGIDIGPSKFTISPYQNFKRLKYPFSFLQLLTPFLSHHPFFLPSFLPSFLYSPPFPPCHTKPSLLMVFSFLCLST